MRNAFIKTLEKIAEKNKKIFLIVGDLGFSVIENFKIKYPSRFLNAGIAEQNMIGVSAGLALKGKLPFVYSIIPFVTMRCFEQIRDDLCYQNLNVKLIGVGGGFAYGTAGSTHHAIEDIAIMRALPNMTIICPGDPLESEAAIINAAKTYGPTYIRLGKGGEKIIHNLDIIKEFKIGKGIVLAKGKDVTLITTGGMLHTGKEICENLKKEGVNAGLISMHTIKPIDKELIKNISKNTNAIFTLEDHNIIGGLGSSVAECLCENGFKGKFKIFGIPDSYPKVTGSQEFLREYFKIDQKSLLSIIKKELK